MNKCINHPETEAIYYDRLGRRNLCSDCEMKWYEDNRMAKRDDPPRLTAYSSMYQIGVGNWNMGHVRSYENHYWDMIVNMSDQYSEFSDYWIPINEVAPWTYTPFFAFKRLLDNQWPVRKNREILVHCHAGIHRSLMMVFCWLHSRGWSLEEAARLIDDAYIVEDYHRDVERGYIPADLDTMYEIMDECPEWSLGGILRDMGKYQLLRNTTPNKFQDDLIMKICAEESTTK